ncbi:PREDICTED: uncharacterized protein LOC108559843 [Nicrophorus vespilloides]|uniref:Uncharacterized protein LOC108559843 n=1 Tax=Nicrophorus vespilloides TaxID=110193 RepID=A0ABM1MDP8_NICVS|nr:PREDICTED: uncharacterized protein LOC108559843 [Nicrophorus vespilloides]
MDITEEYEESTEVLPFFPRYDSETICQDKLRVTWFEIDFSQSRYNFENKVCGSNACTLIVLLVAAICNRENVQCFGPNKQINYYVIRALGRAMLYGNEIHAVLKDKGSLENINLTIPEAIRFSGKKVSGIKEWKSVLYMQSLINTLHVNLNAHWNEWKKSAHSRKHADLYIVLISDSRSVLFIINDIQGTVTLVDSHQHTTTKGALVAAVNQDNLRCLCAWLSHIMFKYHHTLPNLYELSFLYFRKKRK